MGSSNDTAAAAAAEFAAPNCLAQLFIEPPLTITAPEPGVLLLDFGRVAFGNLHLPAGVMVHGPFGCRGETLKIHFGEAMDYSRGRIDRTPPGSVRYACVTLPVSDNPEAAKRLAGDAAPWLVVAPPPDARNTGPQAVPLPEEWGVILPFRWVEIEGWPEDVPRELMPDFVQRRAAYSAEWNDNDAAFECSDHLLNSIWELCRYSIKATTFAGIYVDGDRERADGLITSNADQQKLDLVDWPPGERDGYEFTEINTVVNAFQYRALLHMAELASALGKVEESDGYHAQAASLATAYQHAFFRPATGLYADGESSSHFSQHANMISLAFGLVPAELQPAVIDYVKSRGMACSVYPAQYLLEALFNAGEADHALALITAPGIRSWRHMSESGTTITWEAWDQSFKPNQDWNHAWGAAPANILPRYVLGVQPLEPGYTRVSIRPQLGTTLQWARGIVPTIYGPIHVEARRNPATGCIVTKATAPQGVKLVIAEG